MIMLLIAGGEGRRLYPLSRAGDPKQFQSLVGDQPLLTQAVKRIAPLISPQDIWIVTGEKYAGRIAELNLSVSSEQVITEPFPLGTNLAVGLGLIHIARNNPNETIVIGWADAYIGNEKEFCTALEKAAFLVSEVNGVILAVRPTHPAVGYGYIKVGESVPNHKDFFTISTFTEKPGVEQACEFLKDSSYYWNSGISVWKVSGLLALMKEHQPDHHAALEYVADAIGTSQEKSRMIEAFKELDKTAIDRAVFEKSRGLLALPVDFDWHDVGSWSALYDIQSDGRGGNVTRGEVVAVDSDGCLIHARKHLIAALGVSDLVIVETDDVILVARKEDTQNLKKLYEKIREVGGEKYL